MLKYEQCYHGPKIGSENGKLSRTDILTEIKRAEADAAEAIKKAEADRAVSVADARKRAVGSIQAAEARMREGSEAAISEKKKEMAAEREKLLSIGVAEAAKLEEEVAGQIPKVMDFLNKEVERIL